MRILFLDHAPVFGGAEMNTLNLAAALDRRFYEPLLVVGNNESMIAQARTRGLPVRTLAVERINQLNPRGLLNMWRGARAVAAITRAERADIVQGMTARANIVAALAAPMARCPVLWCLQDITLPRLWVRILGRVPRRTFAVSEFVADFYRPVLSGVSVVYPGVSAGSLSEPGPLRAELNIPADAALIVNVGRLIRSKGQDYFLRAAALVARRLPKAYFVLVGAEEQDEFVAELHVLSRSLGLENRILFAGHRVDAARFFAAADVAVYSAVQPEALGMVVLEAMMHSKPVIASEIGGVRELVLDHETGLLVPPCDTPALADAMVRLLCNPGEAHKMGTAARLRAEGEFALARQVSRMQDIYRSIAGEPPSHAHRH